MTKTNTHTTLDLDRALGEVQTQQANYSKLRGSTALAGMVVDGFIATEKIIAYCSIEDQALILSRYDINMATGSTSIYSPWISAMWGEADHGKPKVKDLDDVEQPHWQPNKSMAVYHHTMEELNAQDFSATTPRKKMIDWIIAQGGSQKVANARKRRIALGAQPGKLATETERRDYYLEHGPKVPIDLDVGSLNLPEKSGKFVTVILEVRDDGKLLYRGLAEKDASAKLTKVADTSHETLRSSVEAKQVLDLAVERARREGREEALAEAKSA